MLQKFTYFLVLFLIANYGFSQAQAEFTPDGVIFPRYTTAQINALPTVQGQVVFNQTTNKLNVYDGSVWREYSGPSVWNQVGNDINYSSGKVGLGLSEPITTLHIADSERVLFGSDTMGAGDKLMFLPDLHAFRVGTIATGAPNTYWNRDSIGLYSFASGFNTRAQGYVGTAMGRDTEAFGDYAFASGYFCNADGENSTAMGYNTDALAIGSTALGYSTDATGNYSTSLNYNTRAQSYASTSIGRYNVGGGNASSWMNSDPIFEIGIGTTSVSSANAMTVLKNGRVGIGTTSPGARLHVVDGAFRIGSLEEITDGGSFIIEFNSSLAPSTNGNRTLGNSTNRWSTVYATNGTINTSDRRLKKNISTIPYGLNEIMELKPVIYQWKKSKDPGFKLGLIAQELVEILPEVVKTHDYEVDEEDEKIFTKVKADRLGVYYSDIIPVLVKGMQEQNALIEGQSDQIQEQNALIYDMKIQLENLKTLVENFNK